MFATRDPQTLRADLLDAAVDLMGRAGRGGTVRVRGVSMIPTLHPGQSLAVEFAPTRLTRGDLLLFHQADYLVVHRLVGPPDGGKARALLTRGDGLSTLDAPVPAERVVGRVLAIQDPEGWRSLRSGGARTYARCIAFHDLAWSALARLAGRADRVLARAHVPALLRRIVWTLDRSLLRCVHHVLFHRLHGRVPPPEEAR